MAEPVPPTYFLDSSAIAKRYIEETGTAWIETLCAPDARKILVLSHIGVVEVAAALAAKRRGNQLDPSAYEEALDDLLSDVQEQQYSLVAVDQAVIDNAVQLTRRRKLRGCDAIQLACALILNQGLLDDDLPGLTFVSADDDLLTAATEEGLATENPNLHP